MIGGHGTVFSEIRLAAEFGSQRAPPTTSRFLSPENNIIGSKLRKNPMH